MSIGGSSGQSQTTTQLDPQLKADWERFNNQAQTVAGQPVPNQQVAAFTPTQLAGQNLSVATAGAGIGNEQQALDSLGRMAGSTYSPTVTATMASAPDSSIMNFTPVQGAQQGDLSPYMNPYTKDVTDTTLNQLDLARQRAINGNSSGATLQGGEGAWGGSRAGVSDALTNEAFGQTAAQTLAGLNQSNFTNAQGQALSYGTLGQQADTTNQGAQLQRGATIYGGDLTTALTNAGAANTASIDNAQFSNDALSRALAAAQSEASAAPTLQSMFGTAGSTVQGVGQTQQQQQQQRLNTAYQNAMNQRNLPLQTAALPFGIIPTTANGSNAATNSSGKSASTG